MAAPAFRFIPEGPYLVDAANGLRLHLYGWPEYSFSVAVEPSSGPQSEAWPVRERAYFEFGVTGDRVDDRPVVKISFAQTHVPFERDYPGRTEELLDAVLPLICPMYDREFTPRNGVYLPVPERLRPLLRKRGSYYSFRDD